MKLRRFALPLAILLLFAGWSSGQFGKWQDGRAFRLVQAESGIDGPASSVKDSAVHGAEHSDNGHSAGHGDPSARTFEFFFFVLVAAVVGRFLARQLRQSAVLGELIIGVALGAILYAANAEVVLLFRHSEDVARAIEMVQNSHLDWQTAIQQAFSPENTPRLTPERRAELVQICLSPSFVSSYSVVNSAQLFSSFGVILLLFMVGLEVSLEDMRAVGGPSLGVAVLGVVLPFGLGYLITWVMLPGESHNVHIFTGATMAATSIGITARVFKDLRKLHLPEAKIVLGAAVLDDILGLIILAVVSGIVVTGTVDLLSIGWILLKSTLFLGVVVLFGLRFLKRNIKFFARIEGSSLRLLYPFALLMMLAFLADLIGLATIVGAFAAGLILKDEYFTEAFQELNTNDDPADDHHGPSSIEAIIAPIEGVFAPVFFVMMGVQVDVSTFANLQTLYVALALTGVAIVGKLLAAIFLRKADKWTVGIGMVPRGEVGLIFASIGKSLGVLDANLFSAVIIVVMLTTFVTPPLLNWRLRAIAK